ncbi:MAG: hypothetical protein EOP93_08540 [Lysobacteraceae bacterium]|nr:MAG: hypothetical protein EOP93_08540 [Xanthomonadaceae bacterium]
MPPWTRGRVTSPPPSSVEALLEALAADGGDVSLPRLCKRLGLRMSVLLRMLAALGETPIGDAPALGYVSVRDDGERQLARITEAGRAWLVEARPPAGA